MLDILTVTTADGKTRSVAARCKRFATADEVDAFLTEATRQTVGAT